VELSMLGEFQTEQKLNFPSIAMFPGLRYRREAVKL
jgi:hypothetical protein